MNHDKHSLKIWAEPDGTFSAEVKRRVAWDAVTEFCKDGDGHFFDDDTMRFFKSQRHGLPRVGVDGHITPSCPRRDRTAHAPTRSFASRRTATHTDHMKAGKEGPGSTTSRSWTPPRVRRTSWCEAKSLPTPGTGTD